MQFEYTGVLLIGLAVCVGLGWLYRHVLRSRSALLQHFAATHLVEQLTANVSEKRRHAKFALLVAAVLCLFVALARPQMGFRWEETHRQGIDILMAVDTSKSMMANDVQPYRLERARLGILDFVSKLEGDRVGLIPFAGSAFLMCPLTLDYDAFRQSLNTLDTSLMPRGGTDIASAIRAAEAAFDKDANHRMLVLITDGEDLEGEALSAAKDAAGRGMIIHTVGVGTPAGELIPVTSRGGGGTFMKDEQGQVVMSRLDEGMLAQIAQITGGAYEPLGTQAEGLEAIYQQKLSLVPETDFAQRIHQVPLERFEWPLLAALILLALEYGLSDRKRTPRAARAKVMTAGRREVHPAVPLVLLMLAVSAVQGEASQQDAAKAYQNGEFEAATEQYQEALARKPEDSTLQFNVGTATYKNGAFDAAAESFGAALASEDLGLQNQAYYNLGNTLYRRGEQTEFEDPQQTIQQWQEALEAYEGALALDAEDDDALFNHDLVKRRLEELQEQHDQEQQEDPQQCSNPSPDEGSENSQSDSSDSEEQQENTQDGSQGEESDEASDQDSDQQKGSEGQDGDQSEENADDDPNDGQGAQSDRSEGEQPEPSQASDEGAEREPEQNADPAGDRDDESQGRPKPQPGQPEPPQQNQGDSSAGVGSRREPGQMTPEEAASLLDSLKGDEEGTPFVPAPTGPAGGRDDDSPRKDW